MIYTIGINNSEFEEKSIEECLNYFKDVEYIQCDSETTGLDCHINDIMCFQLGDYNNQFVIHKDKLIELKYLLESKILIFQNAKFDLKFLYKYNIYPTRIYDTFLAESVLYCGIKLHKKNLASIAQNRLGIDLDKSVRDNIWKKGLTTEVIEYAANDVKYLELIKDHQEQELVSKDLVKALEIENQFVLCLAYIEYCGIKLDVNKWKSKIITNKQDLLKKEEILNKYIIDNNLNSFIQVDNTLFGVETKVTINWSSSTQVVKLFKSLGINTTITEKGERKDSVEAKHIEKYSSQFPIIKLYLEYKQAEKVVSTYGENFINQINPNTDRLHTKFTQIMDTSRLSSGGKDKFTGEEMINFQNIPADPETRSCFITEDNNILIIADYAGQEQIVLANQSLDPSLLEFYDNGLGDMHSFVASKIYPELEGLTLNEIKEHHKDKRQVAKTAGFAINYGGVGDTIARNLNISIEEGNRIYDEYFKAFPGLKDHFDRQKSLGLKKGYVLINNLTNRKSYVHNYDKYITYTGKFDRDYWIRYRDEKSKNSSKFLELKEEVSEYFKIKGNIERKSLNYGIQGTSAEIMKIACINIFNNIRKYNLFKKVLFVNNVHDEAILESPLEYKELVKDFVEKSMFDAGQIYCKRVILKADAVESKYWKK